MSKCLFVTSAVYSKSSLNTVVQEKIFDIMEHENEIRALESTTYIFSFLVLTFVDYTKKILNSVKCKRIRPGLKGKLQRCKDNGKQKKLRMKVNFQGCKVMSHCIRCSCRNCQNLDNCQLLFSNC